MGTKRRAILSLGLLVAFLGLAPAFVSAQQTQQITINPNNPKTETDGHILPAVPSPQSHSYGDDNPLPLTGEQRLSFMKERLERSKSDAAELATLAKELCQALDQPHPDLHSTDVTSHVEKIEKLAKKIREETRGF